jgi:hypothetical protein
MTPHFSQAQCAVIKITHVNPIISLLDQVARIEQRETKPTEVEARLINRSKLMKALMSYMEAQVEALEGNKSAVNAAQRIAEARFRTTPVVEEVVAELRMRIFEIKQLTTQVLH